MLLFVILGLVVVLALGVLGVLFFMLSKEGKKEEESAVPLKDLDQLRKELSSTLLDNPEPRPKELDVIPPFEPKVAPPIQEAISPLEDENYKKHAQELEDELRGIAQKADVQSDEAKKMIETLTEENEALKVQKANLELAQEKLSSLQEETMGLKTENTALQTQLETSSARLKALEEEMAAVKIQMGDEISRAKAAVSQLTQEKEAFIAVPKEEPQDNFKQDLVALQTEQAKLRQQYDELEKANQQLREQNSHLQEKNDLLQYEMIKARAQSSGLERVSFNYKNQLEDFFKKMNAVQVTNDHLSQVKNRLEGSLEQIKSQHEELVKKDQLSQFELEKNRTRLGDLEREYENLKARIQQSGQQ